MSQFRPFKGSLAPRGSAGGLANPAVRLSGHRLRPPPMPIRTRQLAAVLAIALLTCGLSACGSINEKLAAGISDAIPAWAGGLPADAPPRPGTAKYDEYMKERERKRLLPASERGEETKSTPPSQEPTH